MRKICVINQKGGVGKTTTAVNIAAGLSRENRRVLLVDMDPQGNITTSLNINRNKDIYDLLFRNAKANECIVNIAKNFDVIPSKENLTKSETLLQQEKNKFHILKNKLSTVDGKYEYVIIDCPPSLGVLNQNAILYSNEALIPVATDYLSYDALHKMMEAINDINAFYDHFCNITKIIPTMFDKRNKLSNEMLNIMNTEHYGLVSDPIRVCSKLKESPKLGKSIFKHAPSSRGSKDYKVLVRQIIYDEPSEVYESAESSEKVKVAS